MDELITTGQMIDNLKVGEWAISEGIGYIKVTRNLHGEIEHDCGGNLVMGSGVADRKWYVLPNYVTFYEAVQALSEDKTVELSRSDGRKTCFNKNGYGISAAIPFGELLNGRWTIITDNE